MMNTNHVSTAKFYLSTKSNGSYNISNNNGTSSIPLRKPLNRTNSNCSTNSNPSSPVSKIPINNVEKWKEKYESTEQKRKSILIEKEKTIRQNNELQKKYVDLQVKHDQLETELFEANENFTKLRLASETLFKEYEKLKNQYETETGAMARALKDASQWYQENKQLKLRNSMYFPADLDTVDEGVDADDNSSSASSSSSDIENLNKTIKQLSSDVAELQTELDGVRHSEFQTNEDNIRLSEELDSEREKNKLLEGKLAEITKNYEQMIRVSDMLTKEIQELKKSEADQRNTAVILKREADGYKKERNVLAHQSTLLLQGFNEDSNVDSMLLLQEIDQLKRTIEDDRIKYEEDLSSLQEKLDAFENNPQVEVLEERLNLAEEELQAALERANKAEEALKAPPAPPPPPPPPMVPPVVPLRVKRRSRVNVLELVSDAIGVEEQPAKPPAPGVNEDVINAIKLGNFTLRKAKNGEKKEGPKAVSEILNILGNLRRTPKKRQSIVVAADVQL